MTETCIKEQAHTDAWMCDCGIKSQLWGEFFRAEELMSPQLMYPFAQMRNYGS